MGGIFRGLQKRHAVLFRQLHKKAAEGILLRGDDRLGAAGKELLQAAAQLLLRKGLQVGQLGAADHIDAGGHKALEKAGEGKAGAHQLGVADEDLLIGLRVVHDFQVQVADQFFQRDGVLM